MNIRTGFLLLMLPATCLAQDSDPGQPGVIHVTGKATRAVRAYRHLLPGVRDFALHHGLAPQAELRFGLVTQGFPMKPLPLERASLEVESRWFEGASQPSIRTTDTSPAPMDGICGGNKSVFFNTRPWPRLQAYIINEDGRSTRRELNGHRIGAKSLLLELDGDQQWSDNALVEFVFYDNSHWDDVTPAPGK